MFTIPNSVMVPEPIQQRLRCLFVAVESTDSFRQFKNKKWSVDGADLMSFNDVQTTYVESGVRRQQDWAEGLKEAIVGIREMAVFGICVRDRKGLERHPPHLIGWHFTFFVDVEHYRVIFTIKGPISV